MAYGSLTSKNSAPFVSEMTVHTWSVLSPPSLAIVINTINFCLLILFNENFPSTVVNTFCQYFFQNILNFTIFKLPIFWIQPYVLLLPLSFSFFFFYVGSMPNMEPNVGLELTTPRSRTELGSRPAEPTKHLSSSFLPGVGM